MFDIGIYTVMTSVDPLRVYIFTADALIRYNNATYFIFVLVFFDVPRAVSQIQFLNK